MTRLAVHTQDERETIALGRRLGELLRPGDIVALTGELGAGKTTFVKGIAIGLDVRTEITSPTFTLAHEHRGRIPLYHVDLYRIESRDLVADLGLDEYLYGEGITVIEWSEHMAACLPETALFISLSATDDTERDIEFSASSARWAQTIQELSAKC